MFASKLVSVTDVILHLKCVRVCVCVYVYMCVCVGVCVFVCVQVSMHERLYLCGLAFRNIRRCNTTTRCNDLMAETLAHREN